MRSRFAPDTKRFFSLGKEFSVTEREVPTDNFEKKAPFSVAASVEPKDEAGVGRNDRSSGFQPSVRIVDGVEGLAETDTVLLECEPQVSPHFWSGAMPAAPLLSVVPSQSSSIPLEQFGLPGGPSTPAAFSFSVYTSTMMKTNYTMRAKVWLYPGMAAWHFLTLPKKQAHEIKNMFGALAGGWGSLPVLVTLGKVSWKTSLFPDKKSGSYLLPLKADVRKKENIKAGDSVVFKLEIKI